MCQRKQHRCMRCGGVFDCQTPDICIAQYDVLPTIVTEGPTLSDHCPNPPTWEWIRANMVHRSTLEASHV